MARRDFLFQVLFFLNLAELLRVRQFLPTPQAMEHLPRVVREIFLLGLRERERRRRGRRVPDWNREQILGNRAGVPA